MTRDMWEVGNYVIAFVLSIVVWKLLVAWNKHNEERFCVEYTRRFPGKCARCDLHRSFVECGYEEPGSLPSKHDPCPERPQPPY